ncbi:MAG: hypothetical protein U0X93_16800 [Anaerolineales bacterium]
MTRNHRADDGSRFALDRLEQQCLRLNADFVANIERFSSASITKWNTDTPCPPYNMPIG